jgi:hypothetical protein
MGRNEVGRSNDAFTGAYVSYCMNYSSNLLQNRLEGKKIIKGKAIPVRGSGGLQVVRCRGSHIF